MTHLLRALPSVARVGFASVVAYRAEMVIWILTASLPLVMLVLWDAVAADGPVAGFGQAEIARYFAATLVVRQLTGCWLVWALNFEIRTGGLSMKLLRPLHPLWYDAAEMLAALPMRIAILAPMIAMIAWWRPELWLVPSPTAFVMFCVSVALAWTMAFLIQAVFGLLAFWTDQSIGLFGLWFSAWSLLSGYIAPIAMFPEWAKPVLHWLPFRYMLGTPVELLGGFLSPAEALPELAMQAAWVSALVVLVSLLWTRGVARYGAYGA